MDNLDERPRGRQFWRQGDIVVSQAESVDDEFVVGTLSLHSEGGHPHQMATALLQKSEVQRREDGTFDVRAQGAIVKLEEPTELAHPQHATLLLQSGTYLIRYVGLPRRARAVD